MLVRAYIGIYKKLKEKLGLTQDCPEKQEADRKTNNIMNAMLLLCTLYAQVEIKVFFFMNKSLTMTIRYSL